MWTRRGALAGAAAAGAAGGAEAQARDPYALFRTGPLSRNPAAAPFQRVAANAPWPNVTLLSPEGPRSPRDLRGRATILALWAEWCPPCLAEAPDLAGLHRRMGGADVDVLAVLTGSRAGLDLNGARARLAGVGAADLPLWIEPNGGKALFEAFAAHAGVGHSLPCTLLIDRYGRIKGRSFASPPADPTLLPRLLARYGPGPEGRARAAAVLAARPPPTAWSTSAGDEFAAALAAGVLDRV